MKLSESNIKALEYIIDHELDDFNENPSENHVYYHAYSALYGERDADTELQRAIKFQNEIGSKYARN